MTRRDHRTGTFLNAPYDFRKPTRARLRERLWNPDERRIIVPHAFGWGWTLNLHALLRWARVIR